MQNSWEQLWLRQLRWRELAQDPHWDPPHPLLWGGPLGETQGSIWVLSDTTELENYAGYIMSCSTWEAKFTHLFNEITTHHIKSVTCTMKTRQQFHSAVKHWQFWGMKGQPSALKTGTQQWGWSPTQAGVLTHGQIVVSLALKLGVRSSKEATRGPQNI